MSAKYIAFIFLLFVFLFVFTPKAWAYYPGANGRVVSKTGAPISGVWVKWQDKHGNTQYVQTDGSGNYSFPGFDHEFWTEKGEEQIDTNLDGTPDTKRRNIINQDVSDPPTEVPFACRSNPHGFALAQPAQWEGSFSAQTTEIVNNLEETKHIPDIKYDREIPSSEPTATPADTPPPVACGAACTKTDDCAFSKDGCTQCIASTCQSVASPTPGGPACNSSCTTPADCTSAKDGCTVCINNQCKRPPACNAACIKDSDCLGAADGTKSCSSCISGKCSVPPACGAACTKTDDCAFSKDGCTTCVAGSCQKFSSDMCECDGMEIGVAGSGQEVIVTAFGKVLGANIPKAQIQDFKFTVTKDTSIIVQSPKITPEIVEQSSSQVRYQAKWKFAVPSSLDLNAVYRVFNSASCKPKAATSSAQLPESVQSTQLAKTTFQGLVLGTQTSVFDSIWNSIVSLFTGSAPVATTTISSQPTLTPPVTPGQGAMQLRTFTPVEIIQKSCRFIMFKLSSNP